MGSGEEEVVGEKEKEYKQSGPQCQGWRAAIRQPEVGRELNQLEEIAEVMVKGVGRLWGSGNKGIGRCVCCNI